VGESETVGGAIQHLVPNLRGIGVPGVSAGSSLYHNLEEESGHIEEAPQEKVEFGRFRDRLVVSGTQEKEVLQEGEPTLDTMETGGPALGGSPAEQHSTGSGGNATPVPKKTIKDFLRKAK